MESDNMDCIFCKIINGDIPSYKVYEDDKVLAFLDITQTTKGHTLVIPKKHLKNMYELDKETATDVFSVIPRITKALREAFEPMGFNIVNNVDKPTQSVFHFHVHIIPRYPEDGVHLSTPNHMENYKEDDYKKIAEKIKNKLS